MNLACDALKDAKSLGPELASGYLTVRLFEPNPLTKAKHLQEYQVIHFQLPIGILQILAMMAMLRISH